MFSECDSETWMQSENCGTRIGAIKSRHFVHENHYTEQAYAVAKELSTMTLINTHSNSNSNSSSSSAGGEDNSSDSENILNM